MTRIQRKPRIRHVDSFARSCKRDKLIISLASRGLTLEQMKHMASEKNYSQSMIVDIINRDHNDLMIESGLSRKSLRSLLMKLGVQHDHPKYLRLPQEVRLQFKYPVSMSLDEVRVACRKQSRKGAQTTCDIRRNWDNYTPKNHPEYYVKTTSSFEHAERLALEFRQSKSPYSKMFTKYRSMASKDVKQHITELSRNRGLQGLVSMRSGVSRLEDMVSSMLNNFCILHTRQHILDMYAYDIFIQSMNLIVEVNGTYWHADPRIFHADDDIKFPYGVIKARDKWAKDITKNQHAIDRGFQVAVLWEIDLKRKGYLNDYVSGLR